MMSTETKTYNGYANWETWNVCLWFDNEEPLYREYRAMARRKEFTEDSAEEFVRETFPKGTPDMDSPKEYKNVDWQEVADCFNCTD